MKKNQGQSADPSLQAALVRKLHSRAASSGRIVLPAVPSLLEEYVSMCCSTFAAIGITFSPEQLDHLREAIQGQLAQAYAASPRSEIVITYDAPIGLMVNYHVSAQWSSLESAYNNWVATRQPPLFGSEPDARVWALALAAPNPLTFPILDIGAGTGRNAIALARRHHPVDAVEITAKFSQQLQQEAERAEVSVRLIQRDAFTTSQDLRRDYQLILLSEVVSDFRSSKQLRQVFELAARCLAPGGHLVFNVFVARDGYQPSDGARELAQQCYSTLFTRNEIADAAQGLPLVLTSDDSVYDYEKANLPAGAWPPTSWYEAWTSGQDVFDVPREASPMEMRWLVYQKVDERLN